MNKSTATVTNILIVHPDEPVCEAYRRRFVGLPGVEVIVGMFDNIPDHDCFVTAGNAFGIMTAGIDAAVVRYFGRELMDAIQHRILDEYLGEQPIGTAF